MKKKTNWGYYFFIGLLLIVLALGVILLILGLKAGPDPITMPWSVSV